MRVRIFAFCSLLISLLFLGWPVAAQPDAGFVLNTGDVLRVKVARHPEFDAEKVEIPASGTVKLPVVGELKVAGKTLGQVVQDVTKLIANELAKPEVTVTLVSSKERSVTITGQVAKPGKLTMRERWRITDALTAAGGLKISTDRLSVLIFRGGRKILDVPLQSIISGPSVPDNIRLQDSDRIDLVANSVQVTVSGEVLKPGVLNAPLNSGVLDVIELAGGASEEAALGRVTLVPAQGKPRTLDVRKPVAGGAAPVNYRVSEGDTISVPALKFHVSILGSVRKPGFFGLEEGRKLTVADALKRAGGTTSNSILGSVRLLRADGRVQTLDLSAGPATAADGAVELLADDVLTVPAAREIGVEGEVNAPGKYVMSKLSEPRVKDLLAIAGGLKRNPNDARISVLRKLGAKTIEIRIDVQALMVENDDSQNAVLQDKDVVRVQPGEHLLVSVTGEVKQPGVIDMLQGEKLADALRKVGGFTPWAALGSVTVTAKSARTASGLQPGATVQIDAAAAMRDETAQANVELKSGDLISVPKLKSWRLVIGENPAYTEYPFPEAGGLMVADALAAGGLDKTPNGFKYTLLRQGPEGPQRIPVDGRVKNEPGVGLKTPMQPGDILVAPAPKK